MHRTEGTNHSGNLFVDGPPGTTVEEDWLNAMQEEVAYSIEQAGITLKTAATETRTQLKAGIDALADTRIDVADLRRKNALINGSMEHAQRGASGSASFTAATTPANDDDTYLLDRWILLSDGDDIVDVSQETTIIPSDSNIAMKLDVETGNKKFGILQVIEAKNAKRLQGKNVTLSFKARRTGVSIELISAAILSWDGAADVVTSDVVNAWNASGAAPGLVANWTYENVVSNWYDIDNTYKEFSVTGTIDTAGMTNIAVFIWVNDTLLTIGDFLYITDVQLEPGDVVTPFEYRLVGDELALCQRYYEKSYVQAVIPGTDTEVGMIQLVDPVLGGFDSIRFIMGKRTAPTVTSYSSTGPSGKYRDLAAGVSLDATISNIGEFGCSTDFANAGGIDRRKGFQYTARAEL